MSKRTYATSFAKFICEKADEVSFRIPVDERLDGKSTNKNKHGRPIIEVNSAFDITVLPEGDVYDKSGGKKLAKVVRRRSHNGYDMRFSLDDKTVCYDWMCDELYCEEVGKRVTPKDMEICAKIASVYLTTKADSIVKKLTQRAFTNVWVKQTA